MEIFYIPSTGGGQLHCRKWLPESKPKAVVQLVHGIAEHIGRYDHFARFLNQHGYIVTAEDHMGHGGSIVGDLKGYFNGGWMNAVADVKALHDKTAAEHPGLPYIFLGHSMGSFLLRTYLYTYPEALNAAIISGTGWQPAAALKAGLALCKLEEKRLGETKTSPLLNSLIFGTYNKMFKPNRTPNDWICSDDAVVDKYMADPLCGFDATIGLARDMLTGISYLQKPEHLAAMNKALPVFFIAGGDDPVGHYGKGVQKSADAFRRAGMQSVRVRIYPLCRHEILNEINRKDIYRDITDWLAPILGSKKS